MTLRTPFGNMSLIISPMQDASSHTRSLGYAAFISYRHLPRDAEVACEVQRALEGYRLPRHIARKSTLPGVNADAPCEQRRKAFRGGAKLGKCFRDEDELAASHSLPESIEQALAASESLVVICSPETQNSTWVRREIETFEKLHGRERIVCVLAAGSPEESIPPLLKTRMMPDADGIMREMPAEPLAADLRPEAKAKRRIEMLRIIAAVAGCNFDDLRQRERARKRKRVTVASVAAAIAITAASVFAFQLHQAHNAALIAESKSLAAEALGQYAHGEHLEAIETALRALPSSESDTSRPLVPEAQEALEKVLALDPDPEQPWTPLYLFEAEGEIVDVAYSQEGNWTAVLDATGTVSLYSAADGSLLSTATPDIFVSKDNAIPTKDWFIEAAPSTGLVMGNRTGAGGVMYADLTTGEALWQMSDVYPLTAASPKSAANHTSFGLLAFGSHSIAATLIDGLSGQLLAGAELDLDQFPRSANFDTFCIQENPDRAYYALDESIVTFNLNDNSCRQDVISDVMIQSVRSKDDIVAFTAADTADNSEDSSSHPFTIGAARNTDDGFETLWTHEDTFALTVGAQMDTPLPFRTLPQIIDILHCEDDLVIAIAGKKLYVFDLETGEEIFQQELSASIIAAQPCFIQENRYAISLALSDGTLDIISPLLNVSTSTDFSSTTIPFTLDGALLGEDDYGNPIAFVRAADKTNRIYCYLCRPSYDNTVVEDLTLDELLDYARQAIGQS